MKKLPRRRMLKALALRGVSAPKLTHARSIFGRKKPGK
jgi:hypothetical protein